jgi:hypothetical protein
MSSERPETPPLFDDPTEFDPYTCTRRGLCLVTGLRHQGPEILENLGFDNRGVGNSGFPRGRIRELFSPFECCCCGVCEDGLVLIGFGFT